MRRLSICTALVTLLFALPMARAQQIGETDVLPLFDNGNAGLLLAQGPYRVAVPSLLVSLSFYVDQPSSRLRLGVYTDAGGTPGTLVAQSSWFNTTGGWNTADTTEHPVLQPGYYWLAYEPRSNGLAFRKGLEPGVSIRFVSQRWGLLPNTFPASPRADPFHWSFYMTAPPVQPGLVLSMTFDPPAPIISSEEVVGTRVAVVNVARSDDQPFTGAIEFAAPYWDDGGNFMLSGNQLSTRLSAIAAGQHNVTISATQ